MATYVAAPASAPIDLHQVANETNAQIAKLLAEIEKLKARLTAGGL